MTFLESKGRQSTTFSVSLISALVNTLLTLSKIIVGIFGNSQALIADGVHSFSDLLTDGLIIITGWMGAQSPDKEHPYGHRRIETIGSIIIAIILIFTATSIMFDTFQHLIHHAHLLPIPTFLIVIVAVISIIANEVLFRYTIIKGNQINSNLLRTNAWHNRSDSFVSLIVLVSVIGNYLGINYLDVIGACIISILILLMGFKIIWKNGRELIDTAVDNDTLKKIAQTISSVIGVLSVHQLRTRYHGGNIFVDVHIQVAPNISVSEGHYIGERVRLLLLKKIEYISDVTVHTDPENDTISVLSSTLPDRQTVLRLLKDHWETLPHFQKIHRIILHYLNGKLHIEIYLSLTALRDNKKNLLKCQYQKITTDIDIIETVIIYFD